MSLVIELHQILGPNHARMAQLPQQSVLKVQQDATSSYFTKEMKVSLEMFFGVMPHSALNECPWYP
jgi:hypothetical protein